MSDSPAMPPQEFTDHIWRITRLAEQIDDTDVRIELLNAIEELVHGLNGPWSGYRVGWRGDIPDYPDEIEGLF